MIKPTGSGYEFDNDVVYTSPFATHTLRQRSDVLHPSLEVSSDWSLNKGNSITTLITGESAATFINKNGGNRTSRLPTGFISNRGFVNLIKRDGSWTLARFNRSGSATAPSVAELSLVLKGLSRSNGNMKVRGSPLESKRMLDYLQFLMVKKVSESDVSLVRPNNATILQEIRESKSSIQSAYMGVMALPDQSNRTIYDNAYFVSGDKAATLASVIRDIPTIFQSKKNEGDYRFFIADGRGNLDKIQRIIKEDLKSNALFDFTGKSVPTFRGEERTQVLGYNGRPVITKSALFGWFLDTRDVFETTDKNGKKVYRGSNFHGIPTADKVKILFYWAFNYPHPSGRNQPNLLIAEYFMSIVDTFHDFTEGTKNRTISFPELWPSKNSLVWETTKKRTRNGLGLNNIPKSNKAHKFLVDLLGIDIYRRAERDVYNEFAKKSLAKTNTRPGISSSMKTAHFLYFIVNVLATESTRATVTECEHYSRDLVRALVGKPSTPEDITKLMKSKNACLVIDYLPDTNGLTPEMKKLSVYHNVGILDPATSKGILSWGDMRAPPDCPKTLKKTQSKELERILNAMIEKTRNGATPLKGKPLKEARRKAAVQLQRTEKKEATKQQEANNKKRRSNEASQKAANAASSRAERARRKEAPISATAKSPTLKRPRNNAQNTNKPPLPPTSKRPRNNAQNTNKPPLPPTLKRPRNNNQNTNKPPAKKPPLPPRTATGMSRGPNNAPATGTRSARTEQARRTAPPAASTRSATVRPTPGTMRTPGTARPRRTPGTTRTPGTARRTPGTTRTPGTARRTPGTVQV